MKAPDRKGNKNRATKGKKRYPKHFPQRQIEERLRFENLLITISTQFISLPADRIDSAIKTAQKQICECLGIDLCTLWQFSPDHPGTLFLTHFYVSPEFPLEFPESLDAKENYPWALEMMMQKKTVILPRLTDAPPAAEQDLERIRHYGYKSIVICPLYVGDGVSFGAIGFIALKAERDWPEELINRLKIVAQIFANALNRKFIDMNLRESTTRLRLAADSANAGLWAWDYKTGKIWVTEKTRFLYGFSPDEEITADKFFNTLHPDDLKRIRLLVDQSFREGGIVQTEYRVVLPDNLIRWIEVLAQAFVNPSGEPDRMTGVSLDITQSKQDNEEIAELRRELEHISRVMTMSELSTSLAHEINQPLGAILNNASAAKLLLARFKDGHEEIGDILEDIIKDSRRAGDVIRKIRGIVKKGDAQFVPLEMNTLIEEVLELFQGSIRENSVLLHLDLKPDLPKVFGDRVRLLQVLVNLITNALDAMQGGISKKLTVRSTMDGQDKVTVCINDSGIGIDDAKKETIFNPFYSTKKDGLGMGLPICRSIIEEHGGRIRAENNPDTGATVSFSLKVLKGDSA